VNLGEVVPYPWNRLERVPRSAVRAARHVRRSFTAAVTADALARVLGELLTSDVVIAVRKIAPAAFDGTERGVHLETADGAVRLVVEPEPALVTASLARLLGRAVTGPALTDPTAALDPTLKGAVAALCVETARRSGALLAFSATRDAPPPSDGLRLDTTLRLDDRPYGAVVWLFAESPPTGGEPAPDLALLGELPITVPLVAAVSEGARADLESLRPGDVWLPGAGWLHRQVDAANDEAPAVAVRRRAALASPSMERGVETGRSDDGRIVVRANVIALAAETRLSRARVNGERNEAMSEPDETLREIALEALVVVRVEVASVTLTAGEWAKLGPGDVIETGVPLAEPVVLRVGGREVARGELVSMDGELGVRIREIVDPGRSP
jgi:flagellar motor switch protein FliN/FliY